MDRALADELVAMAAADHRAAQETARRAAAGGYVEVQLAWRRMTTAHGDRLNEIMDEHGWPGTSLVGEEAARAAWLVAQHADRQLDVQRRALRLMERAVAAGEAGARELAYLRDRVLVNEGRRQVYGTQVAAVQDGTPVPWPCEEPDRVDARRAEVGLEPLARDQAPDEAPDEARDQARDQARGQEPPPAP